MIVATTKLRRLREEVRARVVNMFLSAAATEVCVGFDREKEEKFFYCYVCD